MDEIFGCWKWVMSKIIKCMADRKKKTDLRTQQYGRFNLWHLITYPCFTKIQHNLFFSSINAALLSIEAKIGIRLFLFCVIKWHRSEVIRSCCRNTKEQLWWVEWPSYVDSFVRSLAFDTINKTETASTVTLAPVAHPQLHQGKNWKSTGLSNFYIQMKLQVFSICQSGST